MLLSLLTASHARAAAEALGGADPESAHLCGMFRNLGEVLVAAHLPEEYTAVLRTLAARPAGARPGRGTATFEVLGCTFEDVGAAVARHWGMPDAVRHGMRATGAPGEARLAALAGFAHTLTDAVYREEAGRSAAAAAALLDGQGARLGVSRALCTRMAERAVADTREVFAAAGLRLDDLRLSRQVVAALADPVAESPDASAVDTPDAEAPAAGSPAAGAGVDGAGHLARTPPEGAAVLGAADPAPSDSAAPGSAAPTVLADVRARLAPELAAAADDPAGYDLSRVLLVALEAVLRGGPFDRACFHAADARAAAFRPRSGLGEGVDVLLGGQGIPFAGGPTGAALLRGDDVLLAHGTRLTLPELQLLRRWDSVSALLLPVHADGVVIGCLHADRRTAFAAPDASAMAYVRSVVRSVERAVSVRRACAPPAADGAAPDGSAPDGAAPVRPAPALAEPEGTPEVARPAVTAAVAPAAELAVAAPAFDAQAKVAAVLRVLRGDAVGAVAAAVGVDAAVLDAWRADFLAGAAARLAG
jgi:hypothetical protein